MDPFFLMIRRGPLTEMGTRFSNRDRFQVSPQVREDSGQDLPEGLAAYLTFQVSRCL